MSMEEVGISAAARGGEKDEERKVPQNYGSGTRIPTPPQQAKGFFSLCFILSSAQEHGAVQWSIHQMGWILSITVTIPRKQISLKP